VKTTISASAKADILTAHRWRQQTMREYNFANARRLEALREVRDVCERHNLTPRQFSRYARGTYKGPK
jgi:hypothetical protein